MEKANPYLFRSLKSCLIICCLTVGKIAQNANFVEGTLEKGVFGRGKTLTSFALREQALKSDFRARILVLQGLLYSIPSLCANQKKQLLWADAAPVNPQIGEILYLFKNQIKGSFLRQIQPHY